MKTLDINTIAFQYLLRTNSQKNNESEFSAVVTLQLKQKQHTDQKSLLLQLYQLEEEAFFI